VTLSVSEREPQIWVEIRFVVAPDQSAVATVVFRTVSRRRFLRA
jgi:hypothetical protein